MSLWGYSEAVSSPMLFSRELENKQVCLKRAMHSPVRWRSAFLSHDTYSPILHSAYVCSSFLFQLCVVLPPVQLVGLRPQKSIPWGTGWQGGSCFASSHFSKSQEPAEVWELRFSFSPEFKVQEWSFVAVHVSQEATIVEMSLSYTGSRQCCLEWEKWVQSTCKRWYLALLGNCSEAPSAQDVNAVLSCLHLQLQDHVQIVLLPSFC